MPGRGGDGSPEPGPEGGTQGEAAWACHLSAGECSALTPEAEGAGPALEAAGLRQRREGEEGLLS